MIKIAFGYSWIHQTGNDRSTSQDILHTCTLWNEALYKIINSNTHTSYSSYFLRGECGFTVYTGYGKGQKTNFIGEYVPCAF